jgi:hypothetical protein|tara:strand:- start:95 stop:385 length:291 start_codon:yes stop_codon:yes gene_type:complete
MIKLTEIITIAGNYDPQLGHVRSDYSLRGLYVNPEYIVSMTENRKFNEIHERDAIVENLTPKAKFTKLVIAAGMHGTTSYDILGDPVQNLVKIQGE